MAASLAGRSPVGSSRRLPTSAMAPGRRLPPSSAEIGESVLGLLGAVGSVQGLPAHSYPGRTVIIPLGHQDRDQEGGVLRNVERFVEPNALTIEVCPDADSWHTRSVLPDATARQGRVARRARFLDLPRQHVRQQVERAPWVRCLRGRLFSPSPLRRQVELGPHLARERGGRPSAAGHGYRLSGSESGIMPTVRRNGSR